LEGLDQERYDLIISDIKMPGMDGPAWKKTRMAMDPAVAERIIFITGDLLSPATQALLEGWKGRRIKKPFEVEELRAMVLEALS
jgi:CheY-like chemotaxis protein